MCIGGGGGGGGSDGTEYLREQERERQRQIAQGTARVNAIFNDPARLGIGENQYQAVFDRANTDLSEQFADSARQIKFNNARTGQFGGSVGAENQGQLEDDYNQGLLRVHELGVNARQSFENADYDAKSRLLDLVQGGLNATSAATRATGALQQNVSQAQNTINQYTLGDAFGKSATIYGANAQRNANRGGAQRYLNDQNYHRNYYGGGGSYSGTIS